MGKLTKTSISFMNFNGIWGNFDRHGLWTFTTHEDVVRPWASILMPAGSLDVISNKFYPRLRNRIGYRAECWKHWNLTRVFILRPSEKHVGIIRQQCLLIFVKKITWIFDFFIIIFTIYHWSTNTAIIHAIEAYYQSYPALSKLPRLTVVIIVKFT